MNPKLVKKLIKYNTDLYEQEAVSWSKTRREIWEQPVIDFVKQIPAGARIADLGCGNGRLLPQIILSQIPQIGNRLRIDYLGIDPSKKFIQLNKKHYCHCEPQKGVAISFEVGDGLKLNYKNQFDCVICLAVLHHIPSNELREKFLQNVFNSLTNNGIILLSVWNRWNKKYRKFLDKPKHLAGLEKNDILVPWENSKHFRYIHCFTLKTLSALTQKMGFEILKTFYANKQGQCSEKEGMALFMTAKKKLNILGGE